MRYYEDETSDFNTTLISEDGRFLGIKLSHDLATQLRAFYPAALGYLRRAAEQVVTPLAESVAKKAWRASDHSATRFGTHAANTIGYGVILSSQIADVVRNIYDSMQSLNDLRVAVKPLANAGSNSKNIAPLSGNNEVVANARGKVNGVFWQRLLDTGIGTIAITPSLYRKITEQAAANKESEIARALDKAKDKNEVKNVLRQEITLDGVGQGIATAQAAGKIREGIEDLIKEESANYKAKLDTFIAEHKNSAQAELQKLVNEITTDNIHEKIEELSSHGIQTQRLNRIVEGRYDYGRHVPYDKEEMQEIIHEFQQAFRSNADHYVKHSLTTQFVSEHGAFDQEQLRYHTATDRDGKRKPTHLEELENNIERIQQRHSEHHDKRGNGNAFEGVPSGTPEMALNLGASFAAEMVKKAFGDKTIEKFAQPIALDYILHLRRTLEKAGDHPPELVPALENGRGFENDVSYTRFVHQIFQQHQRDCGRTEIGDRFVEHLDQARWDDAQIQQMPDDELNPYEYAVKSIAKRIKDGRMDAIALIDLVGDKQNKFVKNDSRSFGPAGAGRSDAQVKEAMRKILDEKSVLIHGGQQQSAAEINDKLGNFIFSVEDLKHALESKEMDKQERAFLFTVFSDVVGSDATLCKKIGISNERCQELRKECKECFTALLDSAVVTLADIISNSPEIIDKQLQLTDKEKQLILSLAERTKEEGKNVTDIVENREDLRSLETVVANATMTLDKAPPGDKEAKSPGFWQRLITAARQPKEVKPVNKETKSFAELEESKAGKRFAEEENVMPAAVERKNWRDQQNQNNAPTEGLGA